jgi:hypothetical protein
MGFTVESEVPCQIETTGRGPLKLNALRTRLPHSAGVLLTPGFMQENAALEPMAHL